MGRYVPLHGISFNSFVIDLRDARVEAVLPLWPRKDGEGWIPSLFSFPEDLSGFYPEAPGWRG